MYQGRWLSITAVAEIVVDPNRNGVESQVTLRNGTEIVTEIGVLSEVVLMDTGLNCVVAFS